MTVKKTPNWVTLITLAIGFIMATLDASVMNVAVATIQKELALTTSNNTWIIDGYLLSFASLLLLGGVLANKFGSKQIYQIGLVIFIIGSILGGFSINSLWLIGSRFIQGLGAAFFMPASLSLLVLSFKDKELRAKMLGIWSAIVSISSGIGPFIGGLLIAWFGWRSIFFINIPLGILGLILAYHYTISPKANRNLKLNILPNFISMVMLGSFAFTLIEGGTYGFSYAPSIISFIIFIVTLVIFVVFEKVSNEPLIPLGLVKIKPFIFTNVTAFLLNACMFGGLFVFGLFLQGEKHSSPLEAGAKLIPMMIVFMIGNIIFSRVVTKVGAHKMLIFGLSLAAIGSILIVLTLHLPYIIYAMIYAFANLGVGIVVPAMTAIAMQSATDQYSNYAGAIFNVARQIGSLFGVALLGVIFYQLPSFMIGAEVSFLIMFIFYAIGIYLTYKSKKVEVK